MSVKEISDLNEAIKVALIKWSPTGKARGTSMFFGGIRRSIPSYAQGFGGLSSSHSSTAIGRGLLRRRINLKGRLR